MPWTKQRYPESMKNLPASIRNKAIEIGNAILKEKKKIKESIVIATSIKKAKALGAKSKDTKKVVAKKKVQPTARKNSKVIAKKKSKPATKKKIKSTIKKSQTKPVKKILKSPVKSKSKARPAKKTKAPLRRPAKIVLNKPVVSAAKVKVKKAAKVSVKEKMQPEIEPKNKTIVKQVVPTPEITNVLPEETMHGEDLNFIPEEGNVHPITPLEAHRVETIFHHKEEVALHQENAKVDDAMSSRKNSQKFFRRRGRR